MTALCHPDHGARLPRRSSEELYRQKSEGGKDLLRYAPEAVMKKILIGMIILFFSAFTFAGTGTDAMSFLKINPSARGASIGDGFVSIVDDVNAVFYNPAGLSQLNDMQFSLMHMLYMAETSYEYASFAMPAGDNLSLGAYVIYLNYGSIDKTTEDLNGVYSASNGSYNPSDMAVAISGSYKLGDLSIGLTAKYATETIDAVSISGVLFDAGILTNLMGIKVGATMCNVGTAGSDKAPMHARLGGSGKLQILAEEDLTVAAGADYVFAGGKVTASAGVEWKYENFLFLRGSYSPLSDADTLNLGLGFRQDLGGFIGEVAYNFSMLGDLGSAHRISVGVKLGDDNGNYNGKAKKKSISKITGTDNGSKQKSALKYYFKKK